jgi:SAM-dependent methyltransferase
MAFVTETDAPPSPTARGRLWSLVLLGAGTLYWELVLIRWLGACIRIVAYYSNFVLIAAFFGLGAGALLARRNLQLSRLIYPVLAGVLLMGAYFAGFYHPNLASKADEFVWIGASAGVPLTTAAELGTSRLLSLTTILTTVYAATCLVFLIFGQWLGRLFAGERPLAAYSAEILGSLVGIFLFAALSFAGAAPPVWVVVGFVLLAPLVRRTALDAIVALACAAGATAVVISFSGHFLWSPYYKIEIRPLTTLLSRDGSQPTTFDAPVGYALTVNNDYHQMLLDLRPRDAEHPFLKAWRAAYDYPYREIQSLPPGPILVVGAGTGNDVSAALRNTDRHVYAVDIDPVIIGVGRRLHPEHPYDNPRVTVVTNDARSFFHHADQKFALVVFGFLDSHTLLSSFSSLRLDNFVYTRESMQEVKNLLVPGGRVALTFASNIWIHQRLIRMLDSVFDFPTATADDPTGYVNGVAYTNGRAPAVVARSEASVSPLVPVDEWPFLYLRQRAIPRHYVLFMGIALAMAAASLGLLPRGERRVRLPYFLLGAAFFLVETSNVINLSLLYGSTWYVNVLVFAGILTLVLLGNVVSLTLPPLRLDVLFGLLALSVLATYAVPTHALLGITSPILQAAAAVAIFLGPVLFGSLVFASLIREETRLDQAYGSNVLGAVAGGVCEYLSLVYGFKFLSALTLVFYLGTFLLLLRSRQPGARAS